MELWNILVKEWPTLQGATVSVVTIAIAATVFGWVSGRFMYGQRIEGLKEALGNADRKIAEYKDKLNGATPEEVKARIDTLEAQLHGLKPAELSQTQVEAFRAAIKKAAPGGVTVARIMGGGDTSRIPKQIRTVFTECGWTVSDAMIVGVPEPSPNGITLHISPIPEFLPLSLVVKDALEAAKIPVAIYKRDERSPDQNPELCFSPAS